MREEYKSEGKCLFCGKTFAKAGITRHMSMHLQDVVKTGQSGQSFFVKVELPKRWGPAPFFLSLWIDGETTLSTLDKFLRDIWLECCGHMSAFRISKSKEIPMSRKVNQVFKKGVVVDYEYDFGSTTELSITVVEEYPVKADKKIVLLSRNEPIQAMCATCNKEAATQICTVCSYKAYSMFCDKCAKKHAKTCEDFDDYASMPVVNSPRMGVCGYTGGSIDVERDGVYQVSN